MKYLLPVLLLCLAGCASTPGEVATAKFEPVNVDAYNEVYKECGKIAGVSCSMNPQLDRLTLLVDMTASPEVTQRGISFMATYYCRLTRLQGDHDNTVVIRRPDGSQTGRPCSLIGGYTE